MPTGGYTAGSKYIGQGPSLAMDINSAFYQEHYIIFWLGLFLIGIGTTIVFFKLLEKFLNEDIDIK